MRQKVLLTLAIFISLFVVAFSFAPSQPVLAETLLQEVPRLDGYRIYFSEAMGEASRFDRSEQGISRFVGLLQILGAQLFTLDWHKDIPADADLVIIAGPSQDLSPDQSARLWSYVNNNGRILFLVDPLVPRIRDGRLTYELNRALVSNRGFFELTWADLGIRARDDVVAIEGENHTIVPRADQVGATNPTPTPLPEVSVAVLTTHFTTSTVDNSHPVSSRNQDELAFFAARSIEFDASLQLFQTTPLIFSDSEFYGETNYQRYLEDGFVEYNIGQDTPRGSLALAAAVENPATGTRIVLIGDRDFITNGGGLRTSPSYTAGFVFPGNVRFLLSSIAWLLDASPENTMELVFPTPGPTATQTITPTPSQMPTAEPVTEPEGNGDDS